MNIALIHDWLNQLGGAEDVLDTLHGMFPAAPIYTSIYDRERMPASWSTWDIRPAWLDRMPAIHKRHQPYMPLFALMWAKARTPAEYDTLLSNKSAFCIGARGLHPHTKHICYCLTPTRFTYDFEAYAQRERIPAGASAILRAMNHALRDWETKAAQHVTHFIAISREVQARIQKHYGRDSTIIYPPVEMPPQTIDERQRTTQEDFYFIVSRLLPYKRIDLAIEACAQLNAPLVIAGAGRDHERLAALIARHPAANIKLMGRVDDATLHDLLTRCKAFIFPGHEDFGIAPIRAMAYGKPVIAFAAGGALDTVIDGETGTLFHQQSVESLMDAMQKNNGVTFAPVHIRRHAEQFSTERFVAAMGDFLNTHS